MPYPIVVLIPARTDTKYFHDYILGKTQIRFVRGRLRFTRGSGAGTEPAPSPSMVVVYNVHSADARGIDLCAAGTEIERR